MLNFIPNSASHLTLPQTFCPHHSLLFDRKSEKWQFRLSSCSDYSGPVLPLSSLSPSSVSQKEPEPIFRVHLAVTAWGADCVRSLRLNARNRRPSWRLAMKLAAPHSPGSSRSAWCARSVARPDHHRPPLSPSLFPLFSSHAKESLAVRSFGGGGGKGENAAGSGESRAEH